MQDNDLIFHGAFINGKWFTQETMSKELKKITWGSIGGNTGGVSYGFESGYQLKHGNHKVITLGSLYIGNTGRTKLTLEICFGLESERFFVGSTVDAMNLVQLYGLEYVAMLNVDIIEEMTRAEELATANNNQ
ncbi:MAG: hypothetical protein V7735_21405 [Photobacterium frigidiphilum]|uniref:hypothetical protein n=1 Tax=Photobacterium frigidiphilum TaxID=264736 RepID=UPI0030010D58